MSSGEEWRQSAEEQPNETYEEEIAYVQADVND